MDGAGLDGPAWKRPRMDGDSGAGMPASRQDSIFYKTRMCIKSARLPPLFQSPFLPAPHPLPAGACAAAAAALPCPCLWGSRHTHGDLTTATRPDAAKPRQTAAGTARRWQDGRCTFGDRCNYAHGEAEMRALPPEGYEILEKREQRRLRQEVRAAASCGRGSCGQPPGNWHLL